MRNWSIGFSTKNINPMTPIENSQIQHIIDWCNETIELGNKATKGPWKVYEGRGGTSEDWVMLAPNKDSIFDCSSQDYEGGGTPPNLEDTKFIVGSRHSSVPIAKMLLLAIQAMQEECKPFNFPDEDRPATYDGLKQIIAIWEEIKKEMEG